MARSRARADRCPRSPAPAPHAFGYDANYAGGCIPPSLPALYCADIRRYGMARVHVVGGAHTVSMTAETAWMRVTGWARSKPQARSRWTDRLLLVRNAVCALAVAVFVF